MDDKTLKNIEQVSKAAVIDRILFHPIDNLITMQQKNGLSCYYNYKLLNQQGYTKFYTGFCWSFVSAIPVRVSTYSTFFISKDWFTEKWHQNHVQSTLQAATLSGIAEALVIFPSDLVRTRSVLSSQPAKLHYATFISFAFLTTRLIVENNIALTGATITLDYMHNQNIEKKPELSSLIGLATGMASQIFSAPLDTLKSLSMDNHKRKFKEQVDLLIKMGIFRGVGAKVLRAGLCNATVFTVIGYKL